MLSNLPRDLAEDVLSRLPVTSLRGVRSTCKKWNRLSTNRSFIMKHIGKANAAAKNYHRKEFQVVMMIQYRVCLFSVNLLNPSIDCIGKLVSLDDVADRVEISKIFHCDGLLLCITRDSSSLVVWNPCSGQTSWIKPMNSYHKLDRYALGHEKKDKYSLRSYKVLRFLDDYVSRVKGLLREFEIYDLNSDSWKVVDVNPDWDIQYHQRGVSLMGNTYWFAHEKLPPAVQGQVRVISDIPDFLLCFDFTTESFGPRLSLPFHAFYGDTVTLSSVREEHLAVLFQQCGGYTVKIWISSKIEPNAVSWNKLFLAVDMKPLTGLGFQFLVIGGSFFVDEKKKVAVVLDKDRGCRGKSRPTRNIAYIIGKKGYFKQVDLGESIDAGCWPLVCSYVPSSVQIKQAAPP
ncbi:PREDICTED: F-box/kelch-repeat protein At3g16740-like [Camelina sativa]|uniref:F-box/kelch-repeat protein At3g16740-like n=1 Tax=Camelina sativa TaxID=90675 RepID=A0ABM0XLF6_CAMSA|nr:PREDICTED: F-box/kelch-repeat protein At3g16740-like [Camelina sativa]